MMMSIEDQITDLEKVEHEIDTLVRCGGPQKGWGQLQDQRANILSDIVKDLARENREMKKEQAVMRQRIDHPEVYIPQDVAKHNIVPGINLTQTAWGTFRWHIDTEELFVESVQFGSRKEALKHLISNDTKWQQPYWAGEKAI